MTETSNKWKKRDEFLKSFEKFRKEKNVNSSVARQGDPDNREGEETNLWHSTGEKLIDELPALNAGPESPGHLDMLNWISKFPHVYGRDDLLNNKVEFDREKLEAARTWYYMILKYRKDVRLHQLIGNEKPTDPELIKDVEDFNELYDKCLKNLPDIQTENSGEKEYLDPYGRQIDADTAEKRKSSGFTVVEVEKGASFGIAYNKSKDSKNVSGETDYVFFVSPNRLSDGNVCQTLKDLQADLKRSDPIWLMTNTTEFRNLKTQLSNTIASYDRLIADDGKDMAEKEKLKAAAEKNMEDLARLSKAYSCRKSADYKRSGKGRDRLRWIASSKLSSLTSGCLMFDSVKDFKKNVDEKAGPEQCAAAFIAAFKNMRKYPEQLYLSEMVCRTYADITPETETQIKAAFWRDDDLKTLNAKRELDDVREKGKEYKNRKKMYEDRKEYLDKRKTAGKGKAAVGEGMTEVIPHA